MYFACAPQLTNCKKALSIHIKTDITEQNIIIGADSIIKLKPLSCLHGLLLICDMKMIDVKDISSDLSVQNSHYIIHYFIHFIYLRRLLAGCRAQYS